MSGSQNQNDLEEKLEILTEQVGRFPEGLTMFRADMLEQVNRFNEGLNLFRTEI